MMMNHTLQQKGQPATSGEMAFMAHLWYAPVHRSEIVPVERGLIFFFFFAHVKLLLDKLWAEEVWFECQVSCV